VENFDYEFMKVVSAYTDLMTDDLFDKIHDIIYYKVMRLRNDFDLDTTESLTCLQIVSNLLEYIDYDITVNNMTGSWMNKTTNQTDPVKAARVEDNLKRAMNLVAMIRNATIYKLSFLQPTIQMTTRMIVYKQILTAQD